MQTTSSQKVAATMQATDRQAKRKTVLEQVGGTKGVIYSALPALVFVVANSVGGLKVGVLAALLVAGGIAAHRLVRRESIQPALGGVFGVAVAAGVSWYTGSAKDFFLIGIWASLGGAVAFVLSVVVRWPLAGLIWNSTTGKGVVWRADRRSRLYYDIATLVLAAIFGARFAVQQYLYQADEVGSLGFAKIAMGYPLLAVGVLAVAWAARASDKRLKAVGLLSGKRS
ncbi:DUF3159 domain-containing protein [Streptomyces sp. NE06-03E]|uniref:DUF3159 domain-containing protein n=3 Tax=Streptomyces TaxID=1883 RepID=A0AAU1LTL4_9ACTN|nr:MULTISPECIES: DUF3159 domain-containing protein [Streptomyces]MBL1286253.1 DUF3159 domain-containing protein [Streptomyces silvae]MDX3057449.1 DUF3159 domain-containing protein [Streptomyces sp. NE06-03E]MDX3326821.1 DUF3159 domain-containing protein [Streptomyces sp. ME02-6979-3A]MDX3429566.1 DUF3159 domain-containing protein [Streptomyces sp. ME01-18a]MDX3686945.1 DUF3159 domain-containing protein [Streptomyces sp. AK04-4c]